MQRRFLPLLLTILLYGPLSPIHSSCVSAQSMDTKTENVIIITMDGLRWREVFGGAVDSMIANPELTSDAARMRKTYLADTKTERRHQLMPFLWDTIASQGQIYGNRDAGSRVDCTNSYLFSYPGYNEILTGFTDGRVNSNAKKWNENKTVLEWLNEKPELNGRVAAFGSWDVFDWIVNEKRSGIPVNSGYNKAEGDRLTDKEEYLNKLQDQAALLWGGVRQDFLTHNYMMEYLKREHPRVVYISYGETDDFAHNGDYHRYLDAANATDGMWRELWAFLQSDPVYADKTSIIITTDHGRGYSPMIKWKDHGRGVDGAREIWMAILGPDTPALGSANSGQLYQNQVAKTAAALLGYDYSNLEEVGDVVPGALATEK